MHLVALGSLLSMYKGISWEVLETHHIWKEKLGSFYCWWPKVLQWAHATCSLMPSQSVFFLPRRVHFCMEREDGKAEPWKAPHKSAVSEEKPKLSPWHTVLILNMLWRLSKKGVCLENTKLYNEGQSVTCQEDTLHETAFSVQVK